MAAALSIFRLNEVDPALFERTFSSQQQQTLVEVGATAGLPPATSILRFRERRGERLHFKAEHLTETIDRPVRVFLDEANTAFQDIQRPKIVPRQGMVAPKSAARDLRYGYQEIHAFDVQLDFEAKEVFVYYTKDVVQQFMRRMKARMDHEPLQLDLQRIATFPEIQNVFGAWVSGDGRVKKHAYFGTELNEEPEIDHARISSYNVEYESDHGLIDLFISRDCRLSSRHPLVTSEHLHQIYGLLKEGLAEPASLNAPEASVNPTNER